MTNTLGVVSTSFAVIDGATNTVSPTAPVVSAAQTTIKQ